MNRYILLLLIITNLFFSCGDKNTIKEDEFYTRGGGLDYVRIPLIKPYEALLLNGRKVWQMNFNYELGISSVSHIRKVNIIQNTILIYSGDTYLEGNKVKEAWFVIIPGLHIERGFSTYGEFEKFLNKQGIKKGTKLYDIDSISNYFDEHRPINWAKLNKLS